MKQGFEQEREYNEALHVQTLSVLRHIAYTTYAVAPKKKGTKNVAIEKFLPLYFDNNKQKVEAATVEDFERIKALHNKKFKK